ncbi:MAG: zinc ribbon domain-containing protein [Lentisphaeria bacterium]|nr:zinc ribbon domain-containing protein [Candidatus Neomarinimicrobiota bacterium]MCF7842132.1 zinc ribbon domain-containing protein [Lentisphaeria bacterium]
MPTYDYECKKCGRRFEVFQRMTDAPLATCPAGICEEAEWGQGEVKRLLSGGAGLIFKGSGFYITDYSKKSTSSSRAEGSSSSSDGDGNKSQKETKPATETSGASKADTGTGKASDIKKKK